jgi:hypothetical protein
MLLGIIVFSCLSNEVYDNEVLGWDTRTSRASVQQKRPLPDWDLMNKALKENSVTS